MQGTPSNNKREQSTIKEKKNSMISGLCSALCSGLLEQTKGLALTLEIMKDFPCQKLALNFWVHSLFSPHF